MQKKNNFFNINQFNRHKICKMILTNFSGGIY